jgi:MFS family permease
VSATRRWEVAVAAIFALAGIGLSSWLSRIVTARAELHLSVFVMGVLSLGLSVGSITGFSVAGRLLRRLSPRRAMLGSLCVAGAGSALVAAAVAGGSPVGLFGALAVLGLGTGACNVVMNVDASAIERSARRAVMPVFHAMWSIGGVIGAGLGAAATAWHLPIPLHLLVLAATTVTATALVVRWIPAPDSPLRTPPGSLASALPSGDPSSSDRLAGAPASGGSASVVAVAERSGWRDRRTLLIGVVLLGMSFANGAANDWISLAMVTGHHVPAAFGALTFWVFVCAATVTRLLGGTVLRLLGRVGALRVSAVCAVVGIGAFILVPSPGLAVVGAVLWGFGSSLGFPIGMSAAGDDGRAAARNIGVVATIGYAGSLAGPPLLGLAGDHLGLLTALTVPLLTVVVAGLLAPVTRQPQPSCTPEHDLAPEPG